MDGSSAALDVLGDVCDGEGVAVVVETFEVELEATGLGLFAAVSTVVLCEGPGVVNGRMVGDGVGDGFEDVVTASVLSEDLDALDDRVVEDRLGDGSMAEDFRVVAPVDVDAVLIPEELDEWNVDDDSIPEVLEDVPSVDVPRELCDVDEDRKDDTPTFEEVGVVFVVTLRLDKVAETRVGNVDRDVIVDARGSNEDRIDVTSAFEDVEDVELGVDVVSRFVAVAVLEDVKAEPSVDTELVKNLDGVGKERVDNNSIPGDGEPVTSVDIAMTELDVVEDDDPAPEEVRDVVSVGTEVVLTFDSVPVVIFPSEM